MTLVCGAHKQELDTLKLELNGYGRRPIAALIKLIFLIVYPFLRKHNWLIRDEVLVGTMPKPYRKNRFQPIQLAADIFFINPYLFYHISKTTQYYIFNLLTTQQETSQFPLETFPRTSIKPLLLDVQSKVF